MNSNKSIINLLPVSGDKKMYGNIDDKYDFIVTPQYFLTQNLLKNVKLTYDIATLFNYSFDPDLMTNQDIRMLYEKVVKSVPVDSKTLIIIPFNFYKKIDPSAQLCKIVKIEC